MTRPVKEHRLAHLGFRLTTEPTSPTLTAFGLTCLVNSSELSTKPRPLFNDHNCPEHSRPTSVTNSVNNGRSHLGDTNRPDISRVEQRTK